MLNQVIDNRVEQFPGPLDVRGSNHSTEVSIIETTVSIIKSNNTPARRNFRVPRARKEKRGERALSPALGRDVLGVERTGKPKPDLATIRSHFIHTLCHPYRLDDHQRCSRLT